MSDIATVVSYGLSLSNQGSKRFGGDWCLLAAARLPSLFDRLAWPGQEQTLGYITLALMTSDDRWNHLIALDEELLKGGVILSEWCSFIVREADTAFAGGAHLASILVAVSGVETYLRAEYSSGRRERLATLIDSSPIDPILKQDLHTLRKYRNKWVHVDDPWSDGALLEKPEETENELEEMAFFAVRALRRTIYENQWIQRRTNKPLHPTAYGVG